MAENVITRELQEEVNNYINRKEIIGIRGARQTGKTTMLKSISDSIKGDKAFINLDKIEYRRTFEDNPLDFVKRFKREGRLFLFLDEIQRVKEAGEKLKLIFDESQDVKVFISGSSSLEMKTNVLPSLVGRLFLFELFTFDFEEFLLFKDGGLTKIHREKKGEVRKFLESGSEFTQPSFVGEFSRYWKEYAIFGGYPEVVKSGSEKEKATILKNIFNLYLEKDITSFFGIEDTSKFEDFLKVLSFTTSNLFSVSSASKELKVPYKKIEEFLTALEHTYIIHMLNPFHRNMVTELKKANKIYFLDLGLRNSAVNNFSHFDTRNDRGEVMENFVLRELVSNFPEWKLNYWRTTGKAEVDFVLTKGKEIIPIEVKNKEESIGKSFYSFLDTYNPERALIVTLDTFKKQKVGNTTVYWIPAFYI